MLELWSLFDFLMPGFLGTEQQFYTRYCRPITLSREAKSSSKEQGAGAFGGVALCHMTSAFGGVALCHMTSAFGGVALCHVTSPSVIVFLLH